MLKTIKSIGSVTEPKKTKVGINSNNMVDSNKITNQINFTKGKNQAKITKSKILVKSKNYDFPLNFRNMEVRPGFFIFKARLAFTKLKQIFIEALILHYFDSKCHI